MNAQSQTHSDIDTVFLKSLLESRADLFAPILSHPQRHEVQILYTRIDRDKKNVPHFTSYGYHLAPTWYFYPASTVKLPACIFALEKLHELNIKGLDKDTPLKIDSAWDRQTKVTMDTSAKNGLASIGQYIRKILLVSDNDAFNRLFEFMGRAEINQRLKANGATQSRIVNRLAIGDKGEWSKHTNPFTFYSGEKIIYRQQAQYDPKEYPLPLQNTIRGKGYMDANDSIIYKPFHFDNLNVYPLADQQHILKKLLFPEVFPKEERFQLSQADYQFLYRYMSMLPTESRFPTYDPTEYWPTYSKFLFFGRQKTRTPEGHIRSFNKYGDSYGYNIDNAYIVDFENGIEFLLTAVVQANKNEIYNDGVYEYETITYPFLANLGQVIYAYEKERNRRFKPNLEKFRF